MITREADYAIRAILYLAKTSEGAPVSSLALASEMGIPYRFMRGIGLKLKRLGLIESRKGNGGGICLAKKPSEISMLDVLREFDKGAMKLNCCLHDKLSCDRSGHCPVHRHMESLQEVMEAHLAALSFDKLLDWNPPLPH